jgi:hypothetical protein
VLLTQVSPYPTHLVLFWKPGEPKPWYLATNLLDPRAVIRLYRRRMWVEEMFGDMKKHGFDLEASDLRHFLRLSRLTLAVCLLYLWLVAFAEHVITHRLTDDIERTDRRDLSLFRLGWDFLERRLALDDPIPCVSIPNFCLMPGDVTHFQVRDAIWMQINFTELLHDFEQQPGFIELDNCVVQVELFQHLTHVGAEAVDVIAEVARKLPGIAEQRVEVIVGGVAKGEPRCFGQQGIPVFQPFINTGVNLAYLLPRWGKHTVNTPQDSKR